MEVEKPEPVEPSHSYRKPRHHHYAPEAKPEPMEVEKPKKEEKKEEKIKDEDNGQPPPPPPSSSSPSGEIKGDEVEVGHREMTEEQIAAYHNKIDEAKQKLEKVEEEIKDELKTDSARPKDRPSRKVKKLEAGLLALQKETEEIVKEFKRVRAEEKEQARLKREAEETEEREKRTRAAALTSEHRRIAADEERTENKDLLEATLAKMPDATSISLPSPPPQSESDPEHVSGLLKDLPPEKLESLKDIDMKMVAMSEKGFEDSKSQLETKLDHINSTKFKRSNEEKEQRWEEEKRKGLEDFERQLVDAENKLRIAISKKEKRRLGELVQKITNNIENLRARKRFALKRDRRELGRYDSASDTFFDDKSESHPRGVPIPAPGSRLVPDDKVERRGRSTSRKQRRQEKSPSPFRRSKSTVSN